MTTLTQISFADDLSDTPATVLAKPVNTGVDWYSLIAVTGIGLGLLWLSERQKQERQPDAIDELIADRNRRMQRLAARTR